MFHEPPHTEGTDRCTAAQTAAPQYLNPGTREINAFLPGPDA